jgi:hypothetical protein
MIKQCIICGAKFKCSPSDRKVTCSIKCRKERAKRVRTGKSNYWSETAKNKLRNKGQTTNLKMGTPAAKQSPIAGSFETNQEALIWTIKSPDGITYTVRNLSLFIKNNPELFDGTVDQAKHGFYAIKQSMTGKRKGSVSQWKGWQLLSWDNPDKKEVEN